MQMNFTRVENISRKLATDAGMTHHAAVAMALALEFAAAHKEFAVRFGSFNKDNLENLLEGMEKPAA